MGQLEGRSRCRPPLPHTHVMVRRDGRDPHSLAIGALSGQFSGRWRACCAGVVCWFLPSNWAGDIPRYLWYYHSITAITSYGAQKRHRNEKPQVMTGDFPYLPSGQETSWWNHLCTIYDIEYDIYIHNMLYIWYDIIIYNMIHNMIYIYLIWYIYI